MSWKSVIQFFTEPFLAPAPPAVPPTTVIKKLPERPLRVIPPNASRLEKEAIRKANMSEAALHADLARDRKAQMLASVDGAIRPFKDQNGLQWYSVLSSNGRGTYNTRITFCSCPDVYGHTHGGCKHMRAVRMYVDRQKKPKRYQPTKMIPVIVAPAPTGRTEIEMAVSKQAIFVKFLKGCTELSFYEHGDHVTASWATGTKLVTRSGKFSELGVTAREMVDYAADHEYQIKRPRAGKKDRLVIRVPANFELWCEACGTKERKVLMAKGQPDRPAMIAETNANMAAQEAVHFGDVVAQRVRASVEAPSGNGNREAPEPVVDLADDPGPLAEVEPAAEPVIVSAMLTAKSVFVVLSDGTSEVRPIREGSSPTRAGAYLAHLGLVKKADAATGDANGSLFFVNPVFVKS